MNLVISWTMGPVAGAGRVRIGYMAAQVLGAAAADSLGVDRVFCGGASACGSIIEQSRNSSSFGNSASGDAGSSARIIASVKTASRTKYGTVA